MSAQDLPSDEDAKAWCTALRKDVVKFHVSKATQDIGPKHEEEEEEEEESGQREDESSQSIYDEVARILIAVEWIPGDDSVGKENLHAKVRERARSSFPNLADPKAGLALATKDLRALKSAVTDALKAARATVQQVEQMFHDINHNVNFNGSQSEVQEFESFAERRRETVPTMKLSTRVLHRLLQSFMARRTKHRMYRIAHLRTRLR